MSENILVVSVSEEKQFLLVRLCRPLQGVSFPRHPPPQNDEPFQLQ